VRVCDDGQDGAWRMGFLHKRVIISGQISSGRARSSFARTCIAPFGGIPFPGLRRELRAGTRDSRTSLGPRW
jgi:hypothetical protein